MYMPWPSDALDGIRDKHIYPLVSCFIFSVVFRLVYNYYRRHCTGERGAEKSGTPATCGDEQHLEDGVLQPNARLDMESDPQGPSTEPFVV